MSRPALGAYPASCSRGTRDSYPGVKCLGNEADRSLLCPRFISVLAVHALFADYLLKYVQDGCIFLIFVARVQAYAFHLVLLSGYNF